MKKLLPLILLFSIEISYTQQAKIQTDDFEIVSASPGLDYVLGHAIRSAHNALNFHKNLFNYKPNEKIFVLFTDFGDYGNGGATSLPHNLVTTNMAPMNYSFESSVAGERVFSIMNHEFVHIAALDKASSSDLAYQKFFRGKVKSSSDHPISIFYSYLTSPRYYSPRWFHEGIAVFIETWMDGGTGNALGNFDEMFFRTKVLENSRIYSALGLAAAGTSADFKSKANYYFYGTRFISYLAYMYGPDKMMDWSKREDGTKRGFSSDFKRVYGMPISEAWDNWIEFEKEFQTKNINKLNEGEVTKDKVISEKVLGGVSHAYHNRESGKIYAAVNYPGKIPHIAEIDLKTGIVKRLHDIKGPSLFNVTSLSFDEKNKILYYTSDNDSRRDLNSYNLNTGQSKLLQKDFRVGDLAFNKADESIWGVKHLNGISTLVRIPKINPEDPKNNYSSWEQKYTLPFGSDMFDMDISPDGKNLSAAVTDLNSNQYLRIFDINSFESGDFKDIKYREVGNFEVSSPQSFKYTNDGKYLYGSSYYTGVSNIYKVDTATLEIEIVSNAETGYFRPILIDDENIFTFKYTSKGFKGVTIPNQGANVSNIDFLGNLTVEKYPVLESWKIDVPNEFNFDDKQINKVEGVYIPKKEVKLSYAYPTVVGYKNNVGIGYKFKYQDPMGFKNLDFSVSYTPENWKNSLNDDGRTLRDDEKWHASFNYRTAVMGGIIPGIYNFYASYNKADFYDLFGPTKRSRKGLNFGLSINKSLFSDAPKSLDLNLGFMGYYGLNQSPEFQQINFENKDFNTNLFYNISSSFVYRNLRGSTGAVDAEKGIKSTLSLSSAYTEGNLFPKVQGTLDLGFQLPINHTALWFRNAYGNSFTKSINPFTRFGFASFGNNYIDNASSKMYRNPYSFAGLSYDSEISIIAKNFYKITAELSLPPIRYRKFGFFNLFANYTHPTIFAGSLFTNNYKDVSGKEMSATYRNIGFQMDTKLVMFSHLSSTLSFGWARAFSIGADSNEFDEWMISLKF